jgi:hypothetical protein
VKQLAKRILRTTEKRGELGSVICCYFVSVVMRPSFCRPRRRVGYELLRFDTNGRGARCRVRRLQHLIRAFNGATICPL